MNSSQTPEGSRCRIDVHAAVPSVEVAHDRDALRVGRPDGEVHAADAAKRRSDARRGDRCTSSNCPSPNRCRS